MAKERSPYLMPLWGEPYLSKPRSFSEILEQGKFFAAVGLLVIGALIAGLGVFTGSAAAVALISAFAHGATPAVSSFVWTAVGIIFFAKGHDLAVIPFRDV